MTHVKFSLWKQWSVKHKIHGQTKAHTMEDQAFERIQKSEKTSKSRFFRPKYFCGIQFTIQYMPERIVEVIFANFTLYVYNLLWNFLQLKRWLSAYNSLFEMRFHNCFLNNSVKFLKNSRSWKIFQGALLPCSHLFMYVCGTCIRECQTLVVWGLVSWTVTILACYILKGEQ